VLTKKSSRHNLTTEAATFRKRFTWRAAENLGRYMPPSTLNFFVSCFIGPMPRIIRFQKQKSHEGASHFGMYGPSWPRFPLIIYGTAAIRQQ
jgi:hypothetical protein